MGASTVEDELKAIAEQYIVNWKTVKEIDKKALSEELPSPADTPAHLLAVDEFSIKKRHRYATTVIDAEVPCVLWVGKDRKQETLEGFFTLFGEENCKGVEAVAMDMWDPFEAATRKHCPSAEIVYDPFHIFWEMNLLSFSIFFIDQAVPGEVSCPIAASIR